MEVNAKSLEASTIQLRPVVAIDLPLLLAWRNELESLPYWSPRRYPLNPAQFEREFQDTENGSTHVRFMVERAQAAIGTVYTYNYSPLHGWAYLAAYLEPASRRQGLGTQAMRQFAAWLFANYPLRKLYNEVYAFNIESNAALQAAGLKPEAVLRQHLYWQGEYHDLLLYALTREQFNTTLIHTSTAGQPVGTVASEDGTRVGAALSNGTDGNPHSNPREGR